MHAGIMLRIIGRGKLLQNYIGAYIRIIIGQKKELISMIGVTFTMVQWCIYSTSVLQEWHDQCSK